MERAVGKKGEGINNHLLEKEANQMRDDKQYKN